MSNLRPSGGTGVVVCDGGVVGRSVVVPLICSQNSFTKKVTYQSVLFDRQYARHFLRYDRSKSLPNQVDNGYNVQVLYYCLVDLLANWKRLYCYQLNRARCLLDPHQYHQARNLKDLSWSDNCRNRYLPGHSEAAGAQHHTFDTVWHHHAMSSLPHGWNIIVYLLSLQDPNISRTLNGNYSGMFSDTVKCQLRQVID